MKREMINRERENRALRYADFDTARCWALTAVSIRAAANAPGNAAVIRQCPNRPTGRVIVPGVNLCFAHYRKYHGGSVALHPDSPANVVAGIAGRAGR